MKCIFLLTVLVFQFNTPSVEAFSPHRQPFSPEGSEDLYIPAMPSADGSNFGAARMQPERPTTATGTIVLVGAFFLSLLVFLSSMYFFIRFKKFLWLGFVLMVFPLWMTFGVYAFLDGVIGIIANGYYARPIVWFCDALFEFIIPIWIGGICLMVYGIIQYFKKRTVV